MRRAVFATAVALCVSLAAAQDCDPEAVCTYTHFAGNNLHTWDFGSLCGQGNGPLGDYTFDDGLGHTYYANICGAAAKKCLPKGWVETYEYGVAVQTWGSVPTCNLTDTANLCADKKGQILECCTEDCQVLGVGSPIYHLNDPTNPLAGLNVTFLGAPPDDDDPFWCPWNPATGAQFSRTVTFSMQCDMSVETAVPLIAIQNKTENCDYLLIFASELACPDVTAAPRPGPKSKGHGLSGGAIFAVILFVGFAVYIVVGMLLTYRVEKQWYCPNRFFWSSVGTHVGRGFNWLVFCGKEGGGAGGEHGKAFVGGGGSTNPYATAGLSASPAAYTTAGSYNAGTSYTATEL